MQATKEKTHRLSIADGVTSLRIASSFLLLLFPLQYWAFIGLYAFTGLTDVLDGWLARKTGTASSFGAKLDSIADLLFYGVLLVRLAPVLWLLLPRSIWYLVFGIMLVRLAAYGTAAIKYHRFAALHTWLNKLTGAALFLLPFFLTGPLGIRYSYFVCAIAFAASTEELFIHLAQDSYCPQIKSILHIRKPCRTV